MPERRPSDQGTDPLVKGAVRTPAPRAAHLDRRRPLGKGSGMDAGRAEPKVAPSQADAPAPAKSTAAPPPPAEPERPPVIQPMPYVPKHPARAAAYIATSALLGITQGLGTQMVGANLFQIQGSIGATQSETMWLMAAYMAPYASLALALVKLRRQFGLRRFAELSILVFVVVALLNSFARDLQSAVILRFIAGISAAPLSALSILYMMEVLPREKKLTIGVSFAMTNLTLAMPIARLISPTLFDIDQWHGLTTFELGLSMLCFCGVYMLPLTSPPQAKVVDPLDFVSYPLIAVGSGCMAVFLTLGRVYWWFERDWLGWLLVISIASLTLAAVIELNRKYPLVDIRWICSPPILHFAGALIIFRTVLAEQSAGIRGLFSQIDVTNAQAMPLYWVVFACVLAGGALSAMVLKPGREPAIHAVALAALAVGAYLDGQSTNLTRPEQLMVSQGLVAFGGALFLPAAMARGFVAAFKKGPNYILSFVVVFLSTQSLGSLFGSALFGTFVQIREKFHSEALIEGLKSTDPIVAERISQLAGSYAGVLGDHALLKAEGAALLSQATSREAYILAYNDAFMAVSALAATALLALTIHVAGARLMKQLQPAPALQTQSS
ncbi:hypothetical protein SAMN03080610_01337 [Afifella marina DSM 2698]|uniref:Major facilitator superfamily (MFS) profile domain-containing protein n=2 Tax=Afifella marina TaxID=1080 RepID=A0A1G5N1C7_AFIMA|nr:hypothetical protein SAMN03080610_01337 [Afifella marina DSM 2698]